MQETDVILQNLIYLFNEDTIRDTIVSRMIKKYNKSRYVWKGTIMLQQDRPFHDYKRWRLSSKKLYMFSVGYIYRGNQVHYVAFVLDPLQKLLICFDPGYNLYLYGIHKIIPIVVKELKQHNIISEKIILKTKCPRKYYRENYGLQYNGRSPYKILLPADAFCQSWTLYFLCSFIESQEDIHFFEEWCKIRPEIREFFILQSFILPYLENIPHPFSNSDINLIKKSILKRYWIKIK